MSIKYIIDNTDLSLSEQIINGDLIVTNIISGTTFYGDGSNLIGVSSEFTGGIVTGSTEFTNGLTANTINSDSFIGDGSQLAGVVGLTYTEMGFTITSPAPSTVNQNVTLPYNSTVTYPNPLIIDPGFVVTVPTGTILTVV